MQDTVNRINDLLDYFEASENEIAAAGDKLIELLRMARAAQVEASEAFKRQLEAIVSEKKTSDQRAALAEAELGRVQTNLAGTRAELKFALEQIKDDAKALAAAREAGEKAKAEAEAILARYQRDVAGLAASRDAAIEELKKAQAEFDESMAKVLDRIGALYAKFTEGNQDVIDTAIAG